MLLSLPSSSERYQVFKILMSFFFFWLKMYLVEKTNQLFCFVVFFLDPSASCCSILRKTPAKSPSLRKHHLCVIPSSKQCFVTKAAAWAPSHLPGGFSLGRSSHFGCRSAFYHPEYEKGLGFNTVTVCHFAKDLRRT